MASITVPTGEIKGRSLWQDARRRLFANKAAVTSMVVLAIIATMSIVMPNVCSTNVTSCIANIELTNPRLKMSSSSWSA